MSMQAGYLDLRFTLHDRTPKGFEVSLVSGAGDATDVRVRYDEAELDRYMLMLDRRAIEPDDLFALGEMLGRMLLPDGDVRRVFDGAMRSHHPYDGVRLRLMITDPALARIPWELTYVSVVEGPPDISRFLALDPKVSIIRHPAMTEAHPSLLGFDPRRLRLVAATATPPDYPPLDLARERQVIEGALAKVSVPGVAIDIVSFVEDATREGLEAALEGGADLFHFAGHAVFAQTDLDPKTGRPIGNGSIALESDAGTAALFPAPGLAIQLEKANVRVAVLGACDGGRLDGVRDWTGVAPALIEKGVAAVVAMQFAVEDRMAVGFAKVFYTAIAKGASVDEATSLGRLELYDRDPAGWQWGVPVLYMRSDDGAIFTSDAARASEPPAATIVRGTRPLPSLEQLFGREAERQRLGTLLADPTTRVVTVVGREGIGKSAIVSVVMAGLEQARWPQPGVDLPVSGIVYHSARDQAFTLDKLYADCARIVGGTAGDNLDRLWANTTVSVEDKFDQLLHDLAGRLNVIVLEDFEALLDEDGQVNDPRTRALFERAVLSAWHVRLLLVSRIPPAFPDSARQFDIRVEVTEGLAEPDGIAMLRSLDPNDTYGVRDSPDPELGLAVRRVHGVPKALQLIFTTLDRDPGLSLDDALGRFYTDETVVRELLERGFEGMGSDPQGVELRRVLQGVAVFRTPVEIAAVEFLLAPFPPAVDVRAGIARLGRMHLVDIDRRTRLIDMSAIDRDYAYSQIPPAGAGGAAELERRAADYYASIRQSAADWKAIDGLDPQLREFDHRMRAGDPDGASAVLATIEVDQLIWRGRAELARWYREQLEGKLTDPRQLAQHAYAVGNIHLVLGPLESALTELDSARDQARALGDERIEADATASGGETQRRLGALADATTRTREAIALYSKLGQTDEESSGRLSLSLTAAYLGDGQGALEEGGRALAMAQTSGDALMRARAEDSLSLACLVLGRLDEAAAHAEASLTAYAAAAAVEPLGYVINVKGMVLVAQGRAADAVGLFEAADKAGSDVQQPRISGLGLFNLARAHRILGDATAAWDGARAADAALRAVGASEAAAAGSFARALKAGLDGDTATEVGELLACATASATSADLQPARDLAEEVVRRAGETGPGAARTRKDARALIRSLKARLARD
jgi:tetratricopeptide (TPR) repeat protein